MKQGNIFTPPAELEAGTYQTLRGSYSSADKISDCKAAAFSIEARSFGFIPYLPGAGMRISVPIGMLFGSVIISALYLYIYPKEFMPVIFQRYCGQSVARFDLRYT